MTRRLPRLAAVAAILAAISCADAAGPGDSAPAQLDIVAGATQEGMAGETLGDLVVLRVTDGGGDPVRGVPVTWSVVSGGGSVEAVSDSTDRDGRAIARWTLGLGARAQRLEARAASLEPAAATATASGRAATITLALDRDSIEVGATAALTATITDNFGDVRTDLSPDVTSLTPGLVAIPSPREVRASAEGAATIRASLHGIHAQLPVRTYDVVTAIAIEAASTTLDIADTLALSARVTGRNGATMTREITWRCEGADVVELCGPTLRPRLVHLASPAEARVIAQSGTVADTLALTIVERPVSRMTVTWPPAPTAVISGFTTSIPTAPATVGDTLRLVVLAVQESPTFMVLPDRPFQLSASPAGIVSVTLGPKGRNGQDRIVNVAGLAAGTARVTIAVNGASVQLDVAVAARSATSCAGGSLSLDLPLGERRTFRAGATAPACLEFTAARDAGRVYVVLADALPETTSKAPQYAAEQFDFEGQGLFREGSLEPAHFPTVRMHSVHGGPVAAATLVRGEAAAAGGARWTTSAGIVREMPVRRDLSLAAANPAPAKQPGSGLSVEATSAVRAGDTLHLPNLGFEWNTDFSTTDGGPVDPRIVIAHIGPRLVVAELLDAVRGRLLYLGQPARAIPGDQLAALEAAYAVPGAQLDSLFGRPLPKSLYAAGVGTRELGEREMLVNMPLPPGFWGFGGVDFVTVNYWLTANGGQPPSAAEITDQLLAHEFTHMRHMSKYWDLDYALPPWVVEGVASFSEGLAAAARLFGTDDPSRLSRWTQRPPGTRTVPRPPSSSLDSFLAGYDESAYAWHYLADHVAARGGNWRRAVLDLVSSAHSRALADAAVASHLPGLTTHDLVVQSRVAGQLEAMRHEGCTDCVIPAALPEWTRYLQYDLTVVGLGAYEAERWPRLVPGAGSGTAFTMRTGALWPTVIDGRGASVDDSWQLDLSRSPQMTISVVRIR